MQAQQLLAAIVEEAEAQAAGVVVGGR